MKKKLLSGFIFIPWLIAIAVVAVSGSAYYNKQIQLNRDAIASISPSPLLSPIPSPVSLVLPNLSAALIASYSLKCLPAPNTPMKGSIAYTDPTTKTVRIETMMSGIKSNLILNQLRYWEWKDGSTEGEIIDVSNMNPHPLETSNELLCDPWNFDPAFFTPPSSVNFVAGINQIEKAWEAKRKLDERIEEINRSLNQ